MARLKALWSKLFGRKSESWIPPVREDSKDLEGSDPNLDAQLFFGTAWPLPNHPTKVKAEAEGAKAMKYFKTIFANPEQRDFAVHLMEKSELKRKSAEAARYHGR